MSDNLQKEIRRLRLFTSASMLGTALLMVTGFKSASREKERFKEIDVERLNVVESDGRVRLALANLPRSPGPIEHGVAFGTGAGERAGIIFYNEEGTENGALVFGGRRDSLAKYSAYASLTFDQYDQDQTVALQYDDENGQRRSGLQINDYRPGVSSAELVRRLKTVRATRDSAARADSMKVLYPFFPKERTYIGRSTDSAAVIRLSDATGHPRLVLRVDANGAAAIEFLDTAGKVVRRYPE